MVVGLIGILKAGAAYLPLDPDYPADRLGFMLADAGAAVLVTQQGLLPKLPQVPQPAPAAQAGGAPPRIVCLDAGWPQIARHPATPPAVAIDPQNPAYVIYTSGSTGTPKGVVVQHGGIPNLAAAQIERFAITAQSRLLQFSSQSFDAAVSEVV
ncbi:MAG: AMP-binding protein, partial [Rhodospirillales bacterium]|nr:AMP-binding protein [Rhodospirillales bacterium]